MGSNEQLWGTIPPCCHIIGHCGVHKPGETHVTDFDRSRGIDQQILRLNISMYIIERVHILQPLQHLVHIPGYKFVREAPGIFFKNFQEIVIKVLKDQMHQAFLSECFIQFDYVFMPQGFENFQFPNCGFFNEFIIIGFFEFLNGECDPLGFGFGLQHHSIGAFAYDIDDVVVVHRMEAILDQNKWKIEKIIRNHKLKRTLNDNVSLFFYCITRSTNYLNFMRFPQKMTIFLLPYFLFSVSCLSLDSNDLLTGDGLFSTASLSNFTLHASHTTTIIDNNGTDAVKLEKPSGQQVSYTEGLSYTFTSSQPIHVQFKFASSNPDTEDSNLRISNSDGESLILFRAGKGGLIRVNEEQMISFYNNSVSSDSQIKMTQIDLLIDWEEKEISVFVDSSFKTKCDFFSGVENVNSLLLYNLYYSVSYWQDLVVCSKICYNFKAEAALILSSILFLLLGFLL